MSLFHNVTFLTKVDVNLPVDGAAVISGALPLPVRFRLGAKALLCAMFYLCLQFKIFPPTNCYLGMNFNLFFKIGMMKILNGTGKIGQYRNY